MTPGTPCRLTIITPKDITLRHPPIADCARYGHSSIFDAAA